MIDLSLGPCSENQKLFGSQKKLLDDLCNKIFILIEEKLCVKSQEIQ